MDGNSRKSDLPAIPLVDLGGQGPVALVEAEGAKFRDLFGAGLAHYGPTFLKLADGVSRRWLERAETPYKPDIEALAARAPGPGLRMLNLSYEWSCTTGVGPQPGGAGNRLLRTLDWPLDGLGRNLVVARIDGPAGLWFNVTWPGFAGAATAMAPGRFAAAINQPPMKRHTFSCWLDWLIERPRVRHRTAIPAMHLLRRVFEQCPSYDAAKQMLTETPIAVPAFFSLSGAGADQGCVIERTETAAYVRDGGRQSVANHWIAGRDSGLPQGRMRGQDSPGRHAMMESCRDRTPDGFDWVRDPILNPTTRLAVVANACQGSLRVRGYEKDGPVTRDFRL